jgi:ribosomal protein S18 acetylase RimI-like enzyme
VSPAVVVRPRRDGDLAALAGVLVEVHALDGYPVEGVGDPGAWLRSDRELGAWVAELDGTPVGHVALTEPGPGDTAADLWARQENSRADAVAVLGRLFVSPAARGHHLGAKLATAATDHAHRLGRRAVLDVMVKDVAAIHVYEALGWRPLGRFDHHFGEGRSEPAVGYVSPRPATSRRTTNIAADGFMIRRGDTRPRYQQTAADVRSNSSWHGR